MEPLDDWRSPHFEQELARLDRGGVTFEFLRRNWRYRQEYAAALERVAFGGADKSKTIARLSSRWGLVFPGRPLCIRLDSATLMVARALSCHGHHHDGARRIRSRRADRPGRARRRHRTD
ncbi:transcriptional regulator domain-containing protein [Pseudochelatococcus sp. B33]